MYLSKDQKQRFRELLEKLLFKKIPRRDYYSSISEFENLLSEIESIMGLRQVLTEADIDNLAKEFKGNSLDKKKRKKVDVQAHKAWAFINKTYLVFKHDNQCQICGGQRILSIHHKIYSEGKRLEDYTEFMLLCKECHMTIHRSMNEVSKNPEGASKASKQFLKKAEKAIKKTEEISKQANRAPKKTSHSSKKDKKNSNKVEPVSKRTGQNPKQTNQGSKKPEEASKQLLNKVERVSKKRKKKKPDKKKHEKQIGVCLTSVS